MFRRWRRLALHLRWWIAGAGTIGAMALVVALAGVFIARAGLPVAPDVTFATGDGTFRVSEHRGDVVLLYFSAPD